MASVITAELVDKAIDAAIANSVTAEEVAQQDRSAYNDMLEAVFTAVHFEIQRQLDAKKVLHS